MRLAALYGDDMASSSGRCGTVRLAGLLGLALLAALQSATAQNAAGSASSHVIPLFTPAGNIQQGFARIINHSHGAGTVRITGTDDAGRSRGPVTLFLDARETRHFNSEDLEEGNASKGLSGGLGDGVGNWRLRMESDLDLEVGAYIRTADGFLSSVHDVVRRAEIGGETVHHVPIFNPASNRNQVSKLRLVNLTRGRVNVRIRGRDDADRPAPGGEVELTLPAGGARQVSTQELESGGAGFGGRLGDGEGKWQLFVSADGDIEVVSLMSTPTGHLTNLSVSGLGGGGTPEAVSPPAVGSVFRDCAGCPEMVGVPSGSYRMGSPADEVDRDADEGPVHRVTIGEPFAVGRYEVTFAQWDACHRAGGCSHRADDQGWGRGTRPVVDVSWHDAQEYVRWLSGETGRSYRLPSEAEWEYVARAGTTTRYWWGDDIGHNRANCDGCGSPWDARQTAPVGSFSPNVFGLYDVHGNVWEWVEDCRNDSYVGAPSDGSAWESGDCARRGIRGGSWQRDTIPRYLRSANRGAHPSGERSFLGAASTGLRVARTLATPVRHALALFRPAGQTQQGFARIINRSGRAGTVHIWGTDNAGDRRGPLSLWFEAGATRHFNSDDVEEGNAAKGLDGTWGDGEGDWRLELASDLDIEPSAYIRTPDGFLTAMHAVARSAEVGGETVHQVPIFNPGNNRNQVSWLRLANLTGASVNVTIRGRDDEGREAPLGEVRLTLPAHGARRISAQQLESGDTGLSGRLGEGEGKWQLFVTADGAIEVVSLLQSPTGHLSNLSTTPRGAPSSSDDHADTIAEATDVAVGSTVSGRIDSLDDVDYFRIQVAQAGILVVWTSGEVATELELLDVHGNPLTSASRASTPRPSGAVDEMSVKTLTLNIASGEVDVQLDDIVIAGVRGKGRVGRFRLESKIVIPGVSNVFRPLPSGIKVSAGGSGYTFDVSTYFSPSEFELKYSATVQQPVPGVPLKLGVTFSGSVMTILGADTGTAYSGPVAITVTVSDPFGLFAVQVLHLEFTREVPSGGLNCVDVEITPLNNTAADCEFFFDGGIKYSARFTNNCRQPVIVKFEWSRFGNSSPGPSGGLSGTISPGDTGNPFSTLCIAGAAPTLKTCAFYSDFSNSQLCSDF